ncbi:MAG TPA: cytochrome C, partial [Desulfuromonadales bacterium]
MPKKFTAVIALLLALPFAAQAGDVTYVKDIKPIVDARCAGCHGSDAPEYPAFKKEKDVWTAKGIEI